MVLHVLHESAIYILFLKMDAASVTSLPASTPFGNNEILKFLPGSDTSRLHISRYGWWCEQWLENDCNILTKACWWVGYSWLLFKFWFFCRCFFNTKLSPKKVRQNGHKIICFISFSLVILSNKIRTVGYLVLLSVFTADHFSISDVSGPYRPNNRMSVLGTFQIGLYFFKPILFTF